MRIAEPWTLEEKEWRRLVDRVRAGRALRPARWPDGARCAVALSFDCDHETFELGAGGTAVGRLAWGEFGRRVEENASFGTDHGTAGPVIVAGSNVNPGLMGTVPNLSDLDDGDLRAGIDFRHVYASILKDWLGLPSEPALGGVFRPLNLVKKA